MQTEEIFLKAPTPFMQAHWHKLLPDWKTAPQVMVIVLLKAKYALEGEGENISQEKERLAARMTILGGEFYRICHQAGILSEVISPKTGLPIYSQEGELNFDLVKTVHASLGFSYARTHKNCKVFQHPTWQTAVYPGLFLSTASANNIRLILEQLPLFRKDNVVLQQQS